MDDEVQRKKKKQIAFVIYPGVSPLNVVGPFQMFSGALMGTNYQAMLVASQVTALETDTPLKLYPHATFSEVTKPYILCVLGGSRPALPHIGDQLLLTYLRVSAKSARMVMSVASGTLALAAAGLLQGHQATTLWDLRSDLEALGARYIHAPWVEDGKFMTASGPSAAIDMTLVVVDRLIGRQRAKIVQLFAEYNPQPPFGGIDWATVEGSTNDGKS